MLYLGEREILTAATRTEVMDAVEQAFKIHSAGDYAMPPRMHVDHQGNTLLYMPCFIPGIFGTKLLTLFPGNAAKQRPVIEGLMLLNDAETGAPLALLNGAQLTALRTGGVGGVGVRRTTPPTAARLGLVGAGVQGWQQVLFAAEARNLQRVFVFDIDSRRLHDFVTRLAAALPGIAVQPAQDAQELLAQSEIVITTTSSNAPVLPERPDLLSGKHFIGIGSYKPDMREFPAALYPLVQQVVVDTEHGLQESGDLITPIQEGWLQPEQVISMGEWLEQAGDAYPGQTTLFKSVGMALLDLVVAELIYRRSLERGLGQEIVY